VTPDEELGQAALKGARAGWFPLGARGAGRFAMQGYGLDITQHSGQGAAFRQSGNTKVLVVTVINGGLVVVVTARYSAARTRSMGTAVLLRICCRLTWPT
jgi:L-aminopeptidase/D-esterase-like protein